MSTHPFVNRLCAGLLVWLGTSALASALTLSTEITSRFLIQGEKATLEYVIDERVDPDAVLKIRQVDNLGINPTGFGAEPRLGFGRRPEYVFRYSVVSYQPGVYTIPPAILETSSGEYRSEPVEIRIFRETDLDWTTTTTRDSGQQIRYAAAFRTPDTDPFLKQVMPTELKVYVPATQRVEDWGIPEFERDGVAAWRFEPRPSLGRVNLLGQSYYAVSYPSTVSPTRVGPVNLGPATLRLITVQSSARNFGNAFYDPVVLEIPALEFDARPLPPGAPEGFNDAVGQFQLNVSATETEVREGDPVTVTLIVSGSGNLDTLNPPTPIDEEGWKLYPPSPMQRDDRRASTGLISFRQFLRPLRQQTQIPPFRLVYFDPVAGSYETLLSNPISLTVLPSTAQGGIGAAAPPEMPVPVEQMTDILGLVGAGGALTSSRPDIPTWWWQLIPALLALGLIGTIVRTRIAPRLHRDPDEIARRRDFRQLESAPGDASGFYRAAGHFVERWLGRSDDPVARDLLAKRDEICFRTDMRDEPMPRNERQRILKNLRRLALPLVALLLTLGVEPLAAGEEQGDAPSAHQAYEEGRYQEAARLWLESGPYDRLTADTLYHVGNAAYRLGSPGEAALFWRRALVRDATHPEARQNLRFFERKFGSIAIKHKEYQYAIAAISLTTWKNLIWAGLWLIALGLLVFAATRSGARLRIAAIGGLVSAPLLIVAGALGWYYFPDEARFSAVDEQAVVVNDRVNIRTDAARNAPLVIEAPAGSLCRILGTSGEWTYVAFTNESRGWIPSSSIKPLIPDGPPEIPEPTDPADADKNA